MGFEDWKSFYLAKKKQMLIEMYVSKQTSEKYPITHSDLLNYYNNIKDKQFVAEDSLEFRLIDIDLKQLTDANDSDAEPAKARAQKLAKEIVEGLESGEDFAEIAKACSHGNRAKYGGLWKPVHPPSLAEPYDVIETEAMQLEPGQVSKPIEVGQHIFIVKLEQKQIGKITPFQEVQQQIENMLIFQRRKKLVDELFNKLLSQTDMSNAEEFIDFCLGRMYQQYN